MEKKTAGVINLFMQSSDIPEPYSEDIIEDIFLLIRKVRIGIGNINNCAAS